MDATELENRISHYEGALRKTANDVTYAALAELYRRSKRFGDAIKTCELGLERFPDNRVMRLILVEVYLDQRRLDEAKDLLQILRELDPRKLSTILLTAEVDIELGNHAEAITLLDGIGTPPGRYTSHMEMLRAATEASGSGPAVADLDLLSEDDLATAMVAVNERLEQERAATVGPSDPAVLLRQLLEVSGVEAAALINNQGEIEAGDDLSDEVRNLIADSNTLWQSFNEFAGELGWGGEFERGLIQADTGQIRLVVVGERMIVVQTQKKISLGMLNLRIEEISKNL